MRESKWAWICWQRWLSAGIVGFFMMSAAAQSIVQMDYGLYVSDFEVDLNRDGIADGLNVYGTWGDQTQSFQAAGATFSIDSTKRLSGQRSQRIVFQRASGAAGTLTVRYDAVSDSRYIQPPAGTPILLRLSLSAENVQGLQYRVRVRSGDRWYTVLPATSSSMTGWTPVSMVIPYETSQENTPIFRVYVEFILPDGAVSGRFWIDSLQVLAQPILVPARARPNPIKMAMSVSGPPDFASFTEVPMTMFLINPQDVWGAKRLLPQAQSMIYFHSNKAYAREDLWSYDLYDYFDCDRNHPEWFLLDANGDRIMDTRYPATRGYYIDPGHPAAQSRAVERLLLLVRDRGVVPDWIYLDGWNAGIRSQQYPTWESILPAWLSLAQRLSPVVRGTLGCKLMINSASQIGLYVDGNIGTQWINLVDGVLHEGALIIYNTSTQQYTYRPYRSSRYPRDFRDASWITVRDAVNAYPDKYWTLLVQCAPNDSEMLRYAVASYLVIQHERCLLALEDRGSSGAHTFLLFNLRPELFVPIGNPVGGSFILQGTEQSGALFARNYEYGIVLVNPTENLTFEYRTPRPYKNWDGQVVPAGTTLTIGPRRGVVLYAAPEVVVSLNPATTTALPGEIVTLTVRIENRGLVDAVDVQVQVPLSEGLAFIGGSEATFSEGRVRWSIARLRPGESITRTFQVRIQ